jgi:hypothetical protein
MLNGFLANLPVIITLLGIAVAGIAGWCDQQAATESLAEKVRDIEKNGTDVSRPHTTQIEVIKKVLDSLEKTQSQFREDNTREHGEIKFLLKDMLKK